jgi:two-component system, cell cycle response regulator DivK
MASKILLVEDNEMNRDMLARRLTKAGFSVVCAANGQEGIDQALQERPDLILMDMNLPVIDGWEATRRIKANGVTKAIPVIALTAYATLRDHEAALASGCDDYETKPIDFQRLLEKIKNLTQGGAK